MSSAEAIAAPAAMTPLEIAIGMALGSALGVPPLPPPAHPSARAALETVVREWLLRPPCVVMFSGGRDSSALLAVATHVARRDGLSPPVAHTMRFPGVADAEESEWQERVVRHLGVDDWVIVSVGGELELVGPIATAGLRRHGVLFPHNGHAVVLAARAAAGGCVLTGVDGDGLFGGWRWERGRWSMRRRAFAALPPAARVAVSVARSARATGAGAGAGGAGGLPWLRPAAGRARWRLLAEQAVAQPTRWDDYVAWFGQRRHLHAAVATLTLHAADAGAALGAPFADPRFLAALAFEGGRDGFGGRTAVMQALVGDLLPETVISRQSKAGFDGAFWGDETRARCGGWDGTGVDPALVDAGALRAHWQATWPPSAASGPLAQHVHLGSPPLGASPP